MIDLATILAVAAMLLLAWDASRETRNPLLMLGGFGLLGAAVLARLFGGGGIVANLTGFLADTGIAFLAASLLMAVRKARAMPFLVLGLLALALAGLFFFGRQIVASGQEAPAPMGSLIVELGPDDRLEEIQHLLQTGTIQVEEAFPTVSLEADDDLAQMYLLIGPRAALDETAAVLRLDSENVDYVEWNETVSLPEPLAAEVSPASAVPAVANDPLLSEQWSMEAVRGHQAHALLANLTPAKKALVAILDTGIDAEHEDLKAAFRLSPGISDLMGHGTHCAGIAGAPANNGVGVASLNWEGRFVEIASFQALPANGSGTFETIAQAIIDASQAGADVISMSLGDYTPIPPRAVSEAVDFAQRRGAIVVASAGNGNQSALEHMPSNLPGVIAVAAVDQNLHKARFSNTTDGLPRPIAAPGVDILSLKPSGQYAPLSGTSMAAPLVAGLLGVMRAINPDLSAEEAYHILHETGSRAADGTPIGRIMNAEASIQAVLGGV
jgi:thermitase